MQHFLDINQSIHQKHPNSLGWAKSILSDFFNIDRFSYFKVYDSGKLIYLNTNLDLVLSNTSEKAVELCPNFCSPKYHQDGTQIYHSEQYFSDLIKQGLLKADSATHIKITSKTNNFSENFIFSSAKLVNHIGDLNLFIKKFRQNNSDLFSCLEESSMAIPNLEQAGFQRNKFREIPLLQTRHKFLETLDLLDSLKISQLDRDILGLVVLGFSASQIAKQVFRSRRTVEHRLEALKAKLGCASKAELIQKFLMSHTPIV